MIFIAEKCLAWMLVGLVNTLISNGTRWIVGWIGRWMDWSTFNIHWILMDWTLGGLVNTFLPIGSGWIVGWIKCWMDW